MNSISLETELKRNQKLKKEDIDALKEWYSTQPHLPKIQDSDLALFLHSNYYSVELAKVNIDNYLTMRSQFTEFFFNRDPVYSLFLRMIFNIVNIVVLPQRTREGYEVILTRLVDTDPIIYIYNDTIKYLNMVLDAHVYELGTAIKGCVFVFDVNGSTSKYGTSVSCSAMKRFFEYAHKGSPVRWVGIHYLALCSTENEKRSFVKTRVIANDFGELMYHHTSLDSLNEFVQPEILPNELGGRAGPLKQLHKAQIAKLESRREWFLSRDKESKVDESLRPPKEESKPEGPAGVAEKDCKSLETDAIKSNAEIVSH